MRKAMTWLIATIVTVGATSAFAADRAVVGLEWGYGPTFRSLGNAKMEQNANLYWKVSDDFTLGVLGGNGAWAMSKKQRDARGGVPGGTPGVTHTLRKEGTIQVSGIRFLKALPMMNMLSGGIDLGVAQFTETSAAITTDVLAMSDGTPVPPATFGAPVAFNATGAVLGLTGRMSIFRAESKTITSEFVLTGSLRYIALPPINAVGTLMDVQDLVGAANTPKSSIGPVRSYHNLGLTLGANIWF